VHISAALFPEQLMDAPDLTQAHAVQRLGSGRHDGAREPHGSRLFQTRQHARHAADFAPQAHFSDRDDVMRDSIAALRTQNGSGDGKIETGITGTQSADDIHEHFALLDLLLEERLDHTDEEFEAASIDTLAATPGSGELFADQ